MNYMDIFSRIENENSKETELKKKKILEMKRKSLAIDYSYIETINEDEEECNDYKEQSKKNKRIEKDIIKFPINTNEIFLRNKSIDYLIYSALTLCSKWNPNRKEQHRFIDSKCLLENKEWFEKVCNMKLESIRKSIKKITKIEGELIELSKIKDRKTYILNYATEFIDEDRHIKYRKFVVIEEEILRFLIENGSKNLIKLYSYLKYRCDENDVKITAKEMAYNIGLSPKSCDSLQKIYEMIKWLEKNNLIKVERKYIVSTNDVKKHTQQHNYYTLVDYKDWIKNY